MPQQTRNSQRILILTQNDAEAAAIVELSAKQNRESFRCVDVPDLCLQIKMNAAAIVIAKTLLDPHNLELLIDTLSSQSGWSNLPLLVLMPEGQEVSDRDVTLDAIEKISNLCIVEYPRRDVLFVRQLRSALAYRERQYRTRELMQELEKSRREAVEADRAKSDFLANMSHEIRTPLGAILGFAELLMDRGTSRREKKDFMLAARRNGQMLSALIDDILDLSRVESGKLEIAKIEFSFAELMSEVVNALEPLASKKGLPLTIDRPKNLDQMITDPIRFKQILVNIIGNAIKFTSHGSVQVRVSAALGQNDLTDLKIEIEDTGIGISSKQASMLFKPFTQADTSATRKFGGTGLGLVLSQKLARAMGGDFNLQWSIPGGGSSFMITLPVKVITEPKSIERSVDVEAALANGQLLPLAGSRILLVDDSLDNQLLISRILNLLGAEVELASDGQEGVDKAMSEVFDVVLMDLQMPRLGGVEATRRLREQGYARPIVALTAHSMQEDRQRCLSVGCTEYLTKPIQRSLLLQVIERVAPQTVPVETQIKH